VTGLLIALAGGLGAGARYLVDAWLSARTAWALHAINISGSFALGVLVGAMGSDAPAWLSVGFLGGFTTLSAASLQAAMLVMDRQYSKAAAHALSMSLGCVAAAAVGFWLGA
jgi:CrcB protein